MFSRLSSFNIRSLLLNRPSVVVALRPTTSAPSQLEIIREQKEQLRTQLEKDFPGPKVYPERDLVNFPKRPRPIHPAKVRLGFAPDSWFEFFYKKTGVTGPYVFGVGLVTFLVSKELYVIEDEFYTGLTIVLMSYIAMKKYGPAARAYVEKLQQNELDDLEKTKSDGIKGAEQGIENSKKEAYYASARDLLISAKRENVHMQREAVYRARLMQSYQQVKKRLDYMLDIDSTRRKFEQRHMVEWIISNVMKSITPQQEKEALQKCVENLKMLSARAS